MRFPLFATHRHVLATILVSRSRLSRRAHGRAEVCSFRRGAEYGLPVRIRRVVRTTEPRYIKVYGRKLHCREEKLHQTLSRPAGTESQQSPSQRCCNRMEGMFCMLHQWQVGCSLQSAKTPLFVVFLLPLHAKWLPLPSIGIEASVLSGQCLAA